MKSKTLPKNTSEKSSKFSSPKKWKYHEISDLIKENKLVIGDDGYRAKNIELSSKGLPFARAGNINKGFQFENMDYFPLEHISKVGNKVSQIGDIVFTSKGTVGRFAFVNSDTPRFVYSPQLCFWRSLDNDLIEFRFLYYWMQSYEFFSQFKEVSGKTDMAEYVSLSDQRQMYITLPHIKEQKSISHILGTIDDKIENLQNQNQILEHIAQTIFKSWFVDFDGVTEFEYSELGKIPKGWKVGFLGDNILNKLISSGIEKFDDYKFYLDTASVDNSTIVKQGIQITYVKRPSRANMQPRTDSVWFAKMKNSRKILWFINFSKYELENFILSTGFAGLEVKDYAFYYVLNIITEKNFEIVKNNLCIGTTQEAINNQGILEIKIINLSESVLQKFNEIVKQNYQKIYQNNHQIHVLIKTRNLLILKLMSREIRV